MQRVKLYGGFSIALGSLLYQSCNDTYTPSSPSYFSPVPQITSITPALSPTTGGIMVDIKGSGFTSGMTVTFQDTPSSLVKVISDSELEVLTPPIAGLQSEVSVRVTNPNLFVDNTAVADHLFAYFPKNLIMETGNEVVGMRPATQVIPIDSKGDGTIVLIAPQSNQEAGTDLVQFSYELENKQIIDGSNPLHFQGSTFYSMKDKVSSMIPVDLNGDNKLDFVVGTSNQILIFLNDGTGKFTAPQVFPAMGPVHVLLPEDFNQDGNTDIGIISGNYAATLLNDGKSGFRLSKLSFAGNDVLSVIAIDFDQDGFLDILGIFNNQLSFLKSNQNGTFQIPSVVNDVPMAKMVVSGDLNGDHKLDFVVATGGFHPKLIPMLNDDGAFQAQTPINLSTRADTLFVRDFNGDKQLDVVAGGSSGDISVFLGNGDGTLQEARSFDGIPGNSIVLLGDINADHKADVIFSPIDGMPPVMKFILNTSQ